MSRSILPFDPLTVPVQGTALIEASAGTGKTYGIAALFARLILLEKLPVDKVLVVTFTKAATAELKTRLRGRLDGAFRRIRGDKMDEEADDFMRGLLEQAARQETPERLELRLKAALSQFDNAAIYTIHGFCQRLLGDYAFLCQVPFETSSADDNDKRDLNTYAQDFWRQNVSHDAQNARLAFHADLTPDQVLQQFSRYLGRPDLLFRRQGLRRPDRTAGSVFGSRPSFFSIQTGVGLGGQRLDILLGNEVLQDDYEEENARGLKLSHALSVSSEGAYFFNRYLAIGGRVRVVSRAVKNLDDFTKQSLYDFSKTFPDLDGFMDDYELTVQSDHLAEFSLSGGLYFNLPLTSRISLGTKLLFGRSYMRDVDIDARVRGHQRDLDFSYEVYKGKRRITCEVLGERKDNGDVYDCSWDYLTVMGNKAFTIGTGLSVNFSYKSLTAWRIFLDYDYSHRNYTIVYDPMHFLEAAARNVTFNGRPVSSVERYVKPNVTSLRRGLSQTVLGAAFSITF